MTSNTSGFTPSRRTLVKGAAWSVPVVAMAQPALAQDVVCSPNNTDPECNPVTPPTSRPGEACKFSGASCDGYKQAYRFVFCLTNHGDEPITVNFTNLHVNGRDNTPIPTAVLVPADGAEHCYYVIVDEQGNSANGQGTLYWNYTWVDEYGRDRYVEGNSPTGVNALPPCDDCSDVYGVEGAAPAPEQPETTEEVQAEEPATEDLTVEEPTTVETQSVEQPAEVTETDAPGDDASQTAQPQG